MVKDAISFGFSLHDLHLARINFRFRFTLLAHASRQPSPLFCIRLLNRHVPNSRLPCLTVTFHCLYLLCQSVFFISLLLTAVKFAVTRDALTHLINSGLLLSSLNVIFISLEFCWSDICLPPSLKDFTRVTVYWKRYCSMNLLTRACVLSPSSSASPNRMTLSLRVSASVWEIVLFIYHGLGRIMVWVEPLISIAFWYSHR